MTIFRNALPLAIALGLSSAAWSATPINEANRPLDADGRIDIENVAGKVEVHAWDKNEVAIEGKIGDGSKLVISGDAKSLHYKVENPENHGWFGFNNGPKEDSVLILKVPAAVRLEVGVVSADATIDGLKGGRTVKVESVSGEVKVSADTERVEIDAVSGDITLAGTAKEVALNTVSGDVKSRGPGGRLKVETVSGNAEFECPTMESLNFSSVSGDARFDVAALGGGDIRAETLSGRLRFTVPADFNLRLRAESFSGNIESDFGSVDREDHGPGSSLDFRPKDSRGDMHLESFSGDVTVRKR